LALALGMNSGSSFDGIDGAIVELEIGPDGHPTPPKVVAQLAYDWPQRVTDQVLRAFSNDMGIFEFTRLNYTLGAIFADLAKRLMDQEGLTAADIDVIGVDGQTIYQEPPDNARIAREGMPEGVIERWLDGPLGVGLQIGEPAVIAAWTDLPVVSNYRPSDHGLGGTGAPLMQYLDWVLFRHYGKPLMTMNIGGITSSTYLPGESRDGILGFDTGPGNVMLDYGMRRLFDREFDEDGAVAASGHSDPRLLDRLREHPFFERKPPRSAWRLDFGADYAESMIQEFSHLSPEDVLATFTDFAGWATVNSLTTYSLKKGDVDLIIASGGGARNPTLMERTQFWLPDGVRLTTCAEFGIPVESKEAMKFATLAFARKRGLANNIRTAGGASAFVSMGRMVLPPRDSILDPAGIPAT
jgi:anhydro-N-acetylmuramic acid kinase